MLYLLLKLVEMAPNELAADFSIGFGRRLRACTFATTAYGGARTDHGTTATSAVDAQSPTAVGDVDDTAVH